MAPVFNLTVQTSAVVRDNVLGRPGAALTPELLARVNAAVLKACDAHDGVADGILELPRQCAWDPSEVLCKPGQAHPMPDATAGRRGTNSVQRRENARGASRRMAARARWVNEAGHCSLASPD